MTPVSRLVPIATGGLIGATIRWGLLELGGTDGFPWPTLVANVVGSGLLAWIAVRPLPPTVVAALGTGFCGGLTTFSTFSLEIVERLDDGSGVQAVAYAVASVASALLAYVGVQRLAGARS